MRAALVAAWRGWRPEDRRACLLAYGLLAIWCFPLYASLDTRGSIGSDWEYFLTYWQAARVAILDFELPGFNPFNCLGTPLWANPQVGPLSHYLPLVLLFGPLAGIKLGITLGYLIAFEAARALGRELFSRASAAVIFGLLYALNAALAAHLTRGQLSFAAYPLAPLLVLAVLRLRKPWAGAWAGLVAALIVHYGVHYFALYALALAALLALWRAAQLREFITLGRFGVLFALVLVAVAGSRLGPMVALMMDHPRDFYPPLSLPPAALLNALFTPNIGSEAAWLRMGGPGSLSLGAWEFEAYVGVSVLAFALLSLRRGLRFYHFGVLVSFWALLGNYQLWHLSRWLGVIPPFGDAWLVFRWRVVLLCCLGLAAAGGVEVWLRWADTRERAGRVLRLAVWLLPLELIVLLLPSWSAHINPYRDTHLSRADLGLAPSAHMVSVGRYTIPKTRKRVLFALARANVGTKYGYEPLFGYGPLKSARLHAGHRAYRGEYVVAGRPVTPKAWSPNALYFSGLPPGEELFVNLNPGRGWSERGRALFSDMRAFEPTRQFRVRVPADGVVALRYRPPGLALGLGASVLAALMLLGLWRRRARS